jgi:hypothetical protein
MMSAPTISEIAPTPAAYRAIREFQDREFGDGYGYILTLTSEAESAQLREIR